MRGNIISYIEMCQKEGTSLQKGMNFRLKGKHSVILMSVRPNAPYRDEVKDDGAVLIYEGHDEPKTIGYAKASLRSSFSRRLWRALSIKFKNFRSIKKKSKPNNERILELIAIGLPRKRPFSHEINEF